MFIIVRVGTHGWWWGAGRRFLIMPSQMPAQASALALPLAKGGALGAYFQIGSHKGVTLDGLKQSASNSLYSPSCHPAAAVLTSKSMETTREWLKDGGKAGAETNRQTSSSATFTPSCVLSSLPYTQDMFQARKTLLTDPHEAYNQLLHSFCPKLPSPQSYASSSSTSTTGPPAWIQDILSTIRQPLYPNHIACSPTTSAPLSTQSLTIMGMSSLLPTHKVTPEWCPWHVPLPPFKEPPSTNPLLQEPRTPALSTPTSLPSQPMARHVVSPYPSSSTHLTVCRR